MMSRVKIGDKYARRTTKVSEMVGYNEQTKYAQVNPVFEWTGELIDTFEM